jgi:hypothetical protein
MHSSHTIVSKSTNLLTSRQWRLEQVRVEVLPGLQMLQAYLRSTFHGFSTIMKIENEIQL